MWELGAVKINFDEPFKLASGNHSPIYFNCRQLISSLKFRAAFVAATRVRFHYPFALFDAVAGGETAGIPYAAFLAEALSVPMAYVRKSVKGHGIAGKVEGGLAPKSRVLLVEDLITDAASKIDFINSLRGEGHIVKDTLVVMDRLQGGAAVLKKEGVALHALTDINEIMEVGETLGHVSSTGGGDLAEYLKDPAEWHAARSLGYIG
jgi:orotate phosphoribosyltransferase